MDPKKHLDLRLLEQFMVVCDTLSMTVAAERLGMSVPAVSQLVVRIERELHVSLFERSRQGLRLTPAGAELRDRARSLLESEGEILDSLKNYRDRLIPQLRLHVLLSVATTLMPAIVSEFGDIVGKINLQSGPSPTFVKDFLSGDLDVLISTEEMTDIPGVEQHFLFEEKLVGIVPASVPVEHRRPELIAEKLAFARFMRGHSRYQLIESYLAGIGLDPSHDIECSSPAPILELVNLGKAWTITTPFSVGYLRPALDKIVWMALPEPVASRKIYLLAHSGRYLDLPQRLAERCRNALSATLTEWRRQPGNEVLANAVRVAKPSTAASPPLRHGRGIATQHQE